MGSWPGFPDDSIHSHKVALFWLVLSSNRIHFRRKIDVKVFKGLLARISVGFYTFP